MSQNNKASYPCEPCGLQTFKRNRYFDGKLLVTRDFEDEQAYLRDKDRLHNSLLHGYGTVCGLKLNQHRNPACRHQYVVLNPGLAIDHCGHEIVVPEEKVIDLRLKIEDALREANRFPEAGEPEPTNVYVRLAYQECATEPVPTLLPDTNCSDAQVEFNRTRETYKLFVTLEDPVSETQDPLAARLDWQHTLTLDHPKAIVSDRDLKRLYVAEYVTTGAERGGWLRMYNTTNHSPIARLPIAEQREPSAIARSNLGDLIYVADSNETTTRIAIFAQGRLEESPDRAQQALLILPNISGVKQLEVSVRDESLFVLTADGHFMRWSSETIRSLVTAVATTQNSTDSLPEDPVVISPISYGQASAPGTNVTYSLQITNKSDDEQGFNIEFRRNNWPTSVSSGSPEITDLDSGASLTVTVTVTIPHEAVSGTTDTAIVTVTPDNNGTQSKTATFFTVAYQPVTQNLSDVTSGETVTTVTPIDMVQSPDGRWMTVADGGAPHLIVLNLSQFDTNAPLPNRMALHQLPPDSIPTAIEISYDGQFLYVLCAANQKLFRAKLRDQLSNYIPDIPTETNDFSELSLADAPGNGTPIDLSVSLRDLWVYVLRRLSDSEGTGSDRGDVVIVSVEKLAGGLATEAFQQGANTEGDPQFQHLALLGQRLYVAGEAPEQEVNSGSISILEIDEIECKNFIRQTLEKECSIRENPQGVIIASITNYRWDQPLVQTRTNSTDNLIDNLTHRPLVPSTNTLRQVIECMLKKGISEGIPGRRGEQGLQGERGDSAVIEAGTFNQVINASWHHDEVLTPNEFQNRFKELGWVVEFKDHVQVRTLHQRSVFALVRFLNEENPTELPLACECVLPLEVEAVTVPEESSGHGLTSVQWLADNTNITTSNEFTLVTDTSDNTGDEVLTTNAVRLKFPPDEVGSSWISEISQFTIVLRGDWILDRQNRGLDGNHIWPGVPEGAILIGETTEGLPPIHIQGRLSGDGTEGGDWISTIHIQQEIYI